MSILLNSDFFYSYVLSEHGSEARMELQSLHIIYFIMCNDSGQWSLNIDSFHIQCRSAFFISPQFAREVTVHSCKRIFYLFIIREQLIIILIIQLA
jgi:hypothetical protein